MYVKIAVNIPADSHFTYSVPEALKADAAVGKRALIPFGRKKLTGYIIGFLQEPDFGDVRDILDILDADPLFTDQDLAFYSWASFYYHYPLGRALHDILPGGIDFKSDYLVKADNLEERSFKQVSGGQEKILNLLMEHPKGLPIKRLQKLLPDQPFRRDLSALLKAGLAIVEETITKPTVRQKTETLVSIAPDGPLPGRLSAGQNKILSCVQERRVIPLSELRSLSSRSTQTVRRLAEKGLVTLTEREIYRTAEESSTWRVQTEIRLNDDQTAAFSKLKSALDSERFTTFLLHGVTGSGKTEVYFQTIQSVLASGGGVLYLVPEIALTPQLISRIRNRFQKEEIAVLHSDVNQGIRYDSWRRLQKGELKIVIGARSALFAPMPDLKLIIVDEEHDGSYKQDVRMCYSARDLAIVRAKMQNAVVVLGSATPDLRTYYSARQGKYTLLNLPNRVENRPLPSVRIVDMKGEKEQAGILPILSAPLITALEQTFHEGMQALLFLNRRGFHTFLLCPDCGYVFCCPNCTFSLTLHAEFERLQCHYCDYAAQAPAHCPRCHGRQIRFYGAGTERLEKEIASRFPDIRTARMDHDTVKRKGSHKRILKAFDQGDFDLLIGTQMITKGHDFQNVTLVGVITADTALNFPDFRSAEKTFQLLTQVSGRGGRGQKEGQVIIQTVNPDHYAIQRAGNHDYSGFYEDEITIRKSLSYPPFSRMISFHFSSLNEAFGRSEVEEFGRRARDFCREEPYGKMNIEIIGPAESPIAKMKGRFRWQILVKCDHLNALHSLTKRLLASHTSRKLDIKVDVDPVNFM